MRKKILVAASAAAMVFALSPGQASAEESPLPITADIEVDATHILPVCLTLTVTPIIPTTSFCVL